MGRERVTDTQSGFSGGLNSVSDPVALAPNQARQMANFRLSTIGAALKRLGTQATAGAITTFDTTDSVAGGLFWPLKKKIYLMAAASGSSALNLWSTSYPAPFSATWTSIGACPQYRPVIFTDGTNETMYLAGYNNARVQKFDGTTISALGSSTAEVAGLVVYNSRLWGWNGSSGTTPNSLYYSNLSTAVGSTGGDSLGDGAAGGGQIVVNTFGPSTIVACAPVGASLLIFHQEGVSRLTGFGQSDITVLPQALTADVGMGRATASGICVYGNVAYFVTDRGIWSATESSVSALNTPETPDPIWPLFQAGTTDPSQVTLIYNRQFNELWVQVNGIGVYTYSTVLNAWAGPFTGTYASGFRAIFEVWEGLGNQPIGTPYGNAHLWLAQFGGSVGPALYVSECDRAGCYLDGMSAGTPSGGTAISAVLQWHRMVGRGAPPFGVQSFVYAKSWRWADMLAQLNAGGPAPIVQFSTQLGGASLYTMSGITSIEQPYYLPAGGLGPYLDVTITDAGTAGTSQYVQASVEGFFLGQR